MILIQAHTKNLVDRALDSQAHAYLLAGPEGAGKGYLARHIATERLGLKTLDDLEKQPYLKIIAPADGSIGIDQVRELQKFLRLKTVGRKSVRRIAILEDAHTMTSEAQNALLKNLEEPPADTIVILTAPATRQIKDTIYSRVQTIAVLPVTLNQAQDYFTAQFEPAAIEKAFRMSGGYAGLLVALLHDDDHALAAAVQTAKSIMTSSTFERLTRVDELSKQKDDLPTLLRACRLIASAALHQAIIKGNQSTIKHWHHTAALLHDTEASLAYTPNARLLLTNVFLRM